MKRNEDIREMLRTDKERRNKYFRTYDPVVGDTSGEVVPRAELELAGRTYWVPTEMLDDLFVKAYHKYGGASGLLRATGQYDTEEKAAKRKKPYSCIAASYILIKFIHAVTFVHNVYLLCSCTLSK